MASALPDLVSNLYEKIPKVKCEIKYKYYYCFIEYINLKADLIDCKYLCCNKNYQ